MILSTLALALLTLRQDTPIEIAKAELPAKAECLICSTSGEDHEEEKPAGGFMYKGKAYYFCNKKELATFKANPDMYVVPAMPYPAPKLSATGLDGKALGLEDYKGKVVLVDFWATWCVPCVAAMPHLNKLQQELGAKGFTVLGVSIDEETKKVGPFAEKKKLAYPVVLDSTTAPSWQSFKVAAIPALFLVDRNGQVIAQWRGKVSQKSLEEAVRAAVEGKS